MKWFLDLHFIGGVFFMSILTIILLAIIVLIVVNFIAKEPKVKYSKLILHLGVFAIVWGILGQTVGMVEAFSVIEEMTDISPALLAGGLKVSAYAPAYGFIIFLISRLGKIALLVANKDGE